MGKNLFLSLLLFVVLISCEDPTLKESTNTGEVGNAYPAIGEVDYEVDVPEEQRRIKGDINGFFNISEYFTGKREVTYFEVIDPEKCPLLAKKISIIYNYPLQKDKMRITFYSYDKNATTCSREPQRIFSGEQSFINSCTSLDFYDNSINCIEDKGPAIVMGVNIDNSSNSLKLITSDGIENREEIKYFKLRWFIPY